MFVYLLILFIVIPVTELHLLIMVGRILGVVPTILLVAFTGVLGAGLAKSQGRKVITAIQKDLAEGSMPTDHLLSGLLVLGGGLLLLTPGIMTDFIGFMLMVPGNRKMLIPFIKSQLTCRMHLRTTIHPGNMGNFGGEPEIKEAECQRVVDEDKEIDKDKDEEIQ